MSDEPTKKEEKVLSILDEAKAERALMEKARDEAKAEREKIEELLARDLISGKTNAGRKEEPAKVESASEYAERITKGQY